MRLPWREEERGPSTTLRDPKRKEEKGERRKERGLKNDD